MKEVTPQEAFELMKNDEDYIYLDVRSVPEFDAGHPEGAINIPLMHYTPSTGMYPNQEFHSVVEGNLSKDAKLVVGCKSGVRSAQACQILDQMGYTNLANVRGGYGGTVDNFGRTVEPGWNTLNLPVSEESDASARYETLSAKSKA
ncbi:MAG TPA: rhodanese-like domain-containing protein [Blastocatellia bacterium]|nr:rhodanese-like domain-containing protein [Blastocatellia bacterium]